MAHRLTPQEIAAAQVDPRFRARPAHDKHSSPAPSEEVIARLLERYGLAYVREDTFFPTQYELRDGREIELGFTPDFYVPALKLYVEVTRQTDLRCKRAKIYNAQSIYGIRVVLIDTHVLANIARCSETFLECLSSRQLAAA